MNGPLALKLYKDRADFLMQAFANEALAAYRQEFDIEFHKAALGRQLTAIQEKLGANKGFQGWRHDVSANLAVNLVTILVIGALVFGYRWMDVWSSRIGEGVGILSNAPVQQDKSEFTSDSR